jgi:serine O-acetyltransferase
MPDPVARAIGQLLDHLQAMDVRVEDMGRALKSLGGEYREKELPELRQEVFECMKERSEAPVAGK